MEAFRQLREHFGQDLERGSLDDVERARAQECRRAEGADELDERMARVARELRAAGEAAAELRLSADGYPLVRAGLLRTYRRGRKAMARAYDDPRAHPGAQLGEVVVVAQEIGQLLGLVPPSC